MNGDSRGMLQPLKDANMRNKNLRLPFITKPEHRNHWEDIFEVNYKFQIDGKIDIDFINKTLPLIREGIMDVDGKIMSLDEVPFRKYVGIGDKTEKCCVCNTTLKNGDKVIKYPGQHFILSSCANKQLEAYWENRFTGMALCTDKDSKGSELKREVFLKWLDFEEVERHKLLQDYI